MNVRIIGSTSTFKLFTARIPPGEGGEFGISRHRNDMIHNELHRRIRMELFRP